METKRNGKIQIHLPNKSGVASKIVSLDVTRQEETKKQEHDQLQSSESSKKQTKKVTADSFMENSDNDREVKSERVRGRQERDKRAGRQEQITPRKRNEEVQRAGRIAQQDRDQQNITQQQRNPPQNRGRNVEQQKGRQDQRREQTPPKRVKKQSPPVKEPEGQSDNEDEASDQSMSGSSSSSHEEEEIIFNEPRRKANSVADQSEQSDNDGENNVDPYANKENDPLPQVLQYYADNVDKQEQFVRAVYNAGQQFKPELFKHTALKNFLSKSLAELNPDFSLQGKTIDYYTKIFIKYMFDKTCYDFWQVKNNKMDFEGIPDALKMDIFLEKVWTEKYEQQLTFLYQ